MSVENLTKYAPVLKFDDWQYPYADMDVSKGGKQYVKFEEAVEASSNSLQQLKAKIAALANEIEGNPTSGYYGLSIAEIFERLRQLSAV